MSAAPRVQDIQDARDITRDITRDIKCHDTYIVQTEIGGCHSSLVWDAAYPLTIGHPLKWIIERTNNGILVRNISKLHNQPRARAFQEVSIDAATSGLELGPGVSLKLRPKRSLHLAFQSEWASSFSGATVEAIELSDLSSFKYFLKIVSGVMAAFLAINLFWPKPKTEELLPPQFAKIVLAKAKVQTSATSPSPSIASNLNDETKHETPAEKKAEAIAELQVIPANNSASLKDKAVVPKRVRDAAVVQAFRSKALQNSVQGLLKGGISRLLEQSDFIIEQNSQATKLARRAFDAPSDALVASSRDIGLADGREGKNVLVASLGGAGSSGSGRVGYAKGEHAIVQDQGHTHVSMDIDNSSVQEGLSKDEVGQIIHRHLSEVRYCYESAILRSPNIEGKLVMQFSITGNGAVKSSEIKSSTLGDPRLDDCILRRLLTWKFPQTHGGIDVAVSYPFIFKTLGR